MIKDDERRSGADPMTADRYNIIIVNASSSVLDGAKAKALSLTATKNSIFERLRLAHWTHVRNDRQEALRIIMICSIYSMCIMVYVDLQGPG